MKKHILVLGAGLVVKPLVNYLLKNESVYLSIVDLDIDRAKVLINDHPRGTAVGTDLKSSNFPELIESHDLVISLLPHSLHPMVAKICLEKKKHLVTASYVSDKMRKFDEAAKSNDLLFLNEMGLDPGIDHMSAMKIINEVRDKGGHIESFRSICGGIPSPEAADNPFKYKFSWSPLGVFLALKSWAKYLHEGEIVDIPESKLCRGIWACSGDLGDCMAHEILYEKSRP